jgi:hypothetical protein
VTIEEQHLQLQRELEALRNQLAISEQQRRQAEELLQQAQQAHQAQQARQAAETAAAVQQAVAAAVAAEQQVATQLRQDKAAAEQALAQLRLEIEQQRQQAAANLQQEQQAAIEQRQAREAALRRAQQHEPTLVALLERLKVPAAIQGQLFADEGLSLATINDFSMAKLHACGFSDLPTAAVVHKALSYYRSPEPLPAELKKEPKQVQRGRRLGTGGTAVVYEGRYGTKQVAIKEFSEEFVRLDRALIMREAAVWRRLHDPHFPTFWGLCEPSPREMWFIMEHCQQNLRSYLDDHGARITEAEKLRIISEIAAALSILHKQQILHRDLKATNILLTSSLEVKLADFGFSRAFDEATVGTSLVGTPGWMAPEVFSAASGYALTPAVDTFAFAMTVMCFGSLPTPGKRRSPNGNQNGVPPFPPTD